MRRFWLLGALLVALLAVGAYELTLWKGFHLARVEVGGASVVAQEDVVHSAAIDPQWNIWLQNMHAASARIEKIPYVQTAYVHRSLPGSVQIQVVERKPDGCVVAASGKRFTVDIQGRVLETGCKRIVQPLYRVADIHDVAEPGTFLHVARLSHLQNDAHALDKAQPQMFVAFTFDAFDELEATMRTGIAVRFGSDVDLEEKTRLLHPILSTLAARLASIQAIDIRSPEAPVVEYKVSGSYRTDTVLPQYGSSKLKKWKARRVVRVGER